MKKRIILIVSCCVIIVVAILLILFMSPKHTYPSVFDSSSKIASNVNFSANFQVSEDSKQVVCMIENNNDYEIIYGDKFYFEIEKDGKWYEVTDRRGKRSDENTWTAKAYDVEANGRKEFTISLNDYRDLSDGNYRIVKYVDISEKNSVSEYIVIAPFQVRDKE